MPSPAALGVLPFADDLGARLRPGPGEPVLWLHGYAMDSSVWEPLWDRLPAWAHLGLDLPGHGGSRPVRPGEDLRVLARTIGQTALGHGVRHVVALSFGCIVATQVALEFPTGFASVVLGAPALAGGPQEPEIEARYEELARLRWAGAGAEELAGRWLATPQLFAAAAGRPELLRRLTALASRHSWAELADFGLFTLLRRPQPVADLAGIQARLLIALGAGELPAFRRTADVIELTVPGCRRAELAEAGHLCLLERPAEAAAVIGAHLQG